MQFDFKFIHRAGVKHHVADALSRHSTNWRNDKDTDDEINVLPIKQQFCKEKHELFYSSQDFDNPNVNVQLHLIMTAISNDEKIPTVSDFVLKQM